MLAMHNVEIRVTRVTVLARLRDSAQATCKRPQLMVVTFRTMLAEQPRPEPTDCRPMPEYLAIIKPDALIGGV